MASANVVKDALKLWASIWPRSLDDKARVEQIKAYSLALSDLADHELVSAAVIVSRRCKFFPTPAEVLEAVRPAISEAVASEASANEAFVGVLAAYERGEQVGPREIRERWGQEAAHAFLCAGGTSAFEWCEPGRDQAFRQKRFVEGYVEASDDAAAQRLALEAGDKAREFSHGEASAALKLIQGKGGAA